MSLGTIKAPPPGLARRTVPPDPGPSSLGSEIEELISGRFGDGSWVWVILWGRLGDGSWVLKEEDSSPSVMLHGITIPRPRGYPRDGSDASIPGGKVPTDGHEEGIVGLVGRGLEEVRNMVIRSWSFCAAVPISINAWRCSRVSTNSPLELGSWDGLVGSLGRGGRAGVGHVGAQRSTDAGLLVRLCVPLVSPP